MTVPPRAARIARRRAPALAVALLCGACVLHHGGPPASGIPPVSGEMRDLFALRYIDVAKGTGALAGPRQCYFAHYTGWLTDGTTFDSSRDTTRTGAARAPISFAQGARRVIAGWDAGFEGMRVGGKRRLFIPYQLGYGEPGRPPTIPPRAELIFDVELVAVADTLPRDAASPVRGQAGPQCPAWSEVGGGETGAGGLEPPTS